MLAFRNKFRKLLPPHPGEVERELGIVENYDEGSVVFYATLLIEGERIGYKFKVSALELSLHLSDEALEDYVVSKLAGKIRDFLKKA